MAKFGFCGPSYSSESLNADCQETINWYNEIIESEDGNSEMVLYPSPGEKVFVNTNPPVNGLWEFDKSVTGSTGAGITGTNVTTPSASPAIATEWALDVSAGSTNTPAIQGISASAPWTAPGFVSNTSYWQQAISGATAFAGTVPLASFWASAMVFFKMVGIASPVIVQSKVILSGGIVAGSYPGTFNNPVVAGNTIMVVIRASLSFAGNSVGVSDTLNGAHMQWADVQSGGVAGGGLAGNGFSYIHIGGVQNVLAGSPTITVVLGQNISGEIQFIELQGGHP